MAWADGGTNALPAIESFESYPAGWAIAQSPGWSLGVAAAPETGRVVTNGVALDALARYIDAGGTLPLGGPHEKVLALNGPLAQRVAGPAGRLVRTESLFLPSRCRELPLPDSALQMGLCFDPDGYPALLHRDVVAGSNEWRVLTEAAPLDTQTWVRVTVLQDYAANMYQVALNGAPLTNAAGWTGPGGSQPGSWFYMPATNGAMSRVLFLGAVGEGYADDVSVVGDRPAIATLPASNVTATAAELPGMLLHPGLADTEVAVYWGTTDGGTNTEAWANTNVWAAPQAAGGFAFTAAASNSVVFYRYAASNAYGHVWATSTEHVVVGAVAVDLLDSVNLAKERPVESGLIRIARPAWSTNVAVTVFYAIGGTASNGIDYSALPGRAVIPAGDAYVDIPVTPIPDGITEGNETVLLTILPGAYLVGSPSLWQVTIRDAAAANVYWRNTSGDRLWNSTSVNWIGSPDGLFLALDRVTFEDLPAATGRVYVGTTPVAPADVRPGAMTVSGGQYEFEGGAVLGGPVRIQGGRVIDRNLALSGFGDGAITLSGNGEFWRQIPPDTAARAQVLTNDFVVTGPGAIEGGRGTNYWTGAVDLRSRLNIGWTNVVTGHTNLLQGVLTVNQDTNYTGGRIVCLQAGGGAAFLDGPIVDDTNATHTGHFPLTLGLSPNAMNLVLRGSNLYTCGTVVTNFGGTNAAVVSGGASCMGTGPVDVKGAGTRLSVQAANGIAGSLTVYAGATATLAADNAVAGVVSIQNGGLLVLQGGNCLPDNGVLDLAATGTVQTASGLTESVGDLYIAGRRLYGARVYTYADYPANITGSGAIRVRIGLPLPGGVLIVR